ncbi:MAG: response regulator [Anaerolineales bacterium]|nr:response regulator [Anaerolineales bacterium]
MSNPKVLIIEDEPGTAEMYRIVLEVEGYEVHIAHTSSSALKFLDQMKPDLILLDVVLRSSSGLDLCRTIRDDLGYNELPIVIVSVRGSPSDVEAGFAAGANDYLRKPVTQDELLEAVRKGLEEVD